MGYDKKTGKRKCMKYSQRGKRNRARGMNRGKKRNWARSLPALNGQVDGINGDNLSASLPSFQMSGTIASQESRDVMIGTTLQSGGMQVNDLASHPRKSNKRKTKNDLLLEQKYGSSGKTGAEILAEAKTSKRSKNYPAPPRMDERIPDNTKIYEVGRNLSGVFTILSAITRGKMLVIQAYVPSDQVTVEKMLSVHDVQRIMSDQVELLQRYKREELCRALISRVTFFFRDGKRVLLIEEGKRKRKSQTKKKVKESTKTKQQKNSPSKTGDITEDKIEVNDKQTSKVGKKTNNNMEMSNEERNDKLLLQQRLEKVFRCIIKLPKSTHLGQYLLCNVYEGWQLQGLNVSTNEIVQARIPPLLTDQLTAPGIMKKDRISILREFLIEENIVKRPRSKFDVHQHRKTRRDNRR